MGRYHQGPEHQELQTLFSKRWPIDGTSKKLCDDLDCWMFHHNGEGKH